MEQVLLMNRNEVDRIDMRLVNMERLIMEMTKAVQNTNVTDSNPGNPDFISIKDAAKKYNKSRQTINAKMKLFEEHHGRPIDRAMICGENLINQHELFKAMQLRGALPKSFQHKSDPNRRKSEITPRITP